MTSRLLMSTAAAALLFALPAVAQTSTPNPNMPRQTMPNASQQMSKSDMNFMKEAAQGGMAEVEFGKLAQQNAQSDEVKQFGQRMVTDHGNANQQLTSLASSKGITLPTQLDKKDEQTRDRLSKLQGEKFDRAYMATMVKDHDKDVNAFKHEAQNAKDPDLKQFAQQTLTVIEQHDQLAKNVDHSLTATGSSRPPR